MGLYYSPGLKTKRRIFGNVCSNASSRTQSSGTLKHKLGSIEEIPEEDKEIRASQTSWPA